MAWDVDPVVKKKSKSNTEVVVAGLVYSAAVLAVVFAVPVLLYYIRIWANYWSLP